MRHGRHRHRISELQKYTMIDRIYNACLARIRTYILESRSANPEYKKRESRRIRTYKNELAEYLYYCKCVDRVDSCRLKLKEIIESHTSETSEKSSQDQTGRGSEDISKFYDYKVSGEPNVHWKNIVTKKKYSVHFEPAMDGSIDPEELYAMCMLDMVSREYNINGDNSTYMSLSLHHPDLQTPFNIPFRKIEAFTTDFLKREMAGLRQSARNIADIGDGDFTVEVSMVEMPQGSGRMPMAKIIEKMAPQAEGPNITANNVTEMCLPIAIVQAILYMRKTLKPKNKKLNLEWRQAARINSSKPYAAKSIFRQAETILRHAGVNKRQNFDIDDIQAIQQSLTEYQIVLFDSKYNTTPTFEGPFKGDNKVLALLHSNGHFQHIKKLHVYLRAQFYCVHCHVKGNSQRSHYKCPLTCRKCLRRNAVCIDHHTEISCTGCSIVFYSEECFDAHKQKGPRNGKSRCEETVICHLCGDAYYTERKTEHVCGAKYCRQCNRKHGEEATCYLTTKPQKKEMSTKRIFYDFETAFEHNNEGLKVHIPVLVMALKCCPFCADQTFTTRKEMEELECQSCAPGEKRFKTIDCVQPGNEDIDVAVTFVEWLLQASHAGYVAVAHNMKAFDGQIILHQLLEDYKPSPKTLVLTGTKIQYMCVNKVKFVDSYNFITAALQTFPKAFDLAELKKGYFPYKFIRKKNFAYVGTIPLLEFYGYNDMASDKQIPLKKYHLDKQTDPQYVFNFQEELFDYCASDVALLAAGMTKFEKTFEELTNVLLLDESATAASAAMTTYRRNFVKPNTIALDKNLGRVKQSKIATQYLLWRQHSENIDIQMAATTGEYKIPGTRYHVDGFVAPCAVYPKGKAIEVKGCYYHACPKEYSATSIIRDGHTAAEIWELDRRREEKIRQHCDLETIWTCEIMDQRKIDKNMDAWMKNAPVRGMVHIRDALYGGRTEVIRLKSERDKEYDISYNDVTSLYPAVMKYDLFPTTRGDNIDVKGVKIPISSPEDLQIRGFVTCRVLPPKKLFIPVLPLRIAGKLLFPLCRACCLFVERDEEPPICKHTEKKRSFVGTYFTGELCLALEKGYTIVEIHGAVNYATWEQYGNNNGIIEHSLFSAYVDTFLKLKQEASGYPKSVRTDAEKNKYIEEYFEKEGIRLEKDKIGSQPVIRQVAKILLNCLWGKFGERTDKLENTITHSPVILWKLLTDSTREVRDIVVTGRRKIIVVHKKLEECTEPLPTSATHLAAITTAHARIRLYRIIDAIPEPEKNLLYMDTDSVIFRHKKNQNPLDSRIGNFLGQLTNEVPDGYIERYVSVGPKSYGYKIVDGNTSKVYIKAKGFPRCHEVEKKLTIDLMEKLVDQVLCKNMRDSIPISYRSINRDSEHNLKNVKITKIFKYTFNKRRLLLNGTSLPLGF